MRRPGKPNEPEEPMLFDLPLSGHEPEEEPAEPLPAPKRSSSREPRRAGPVPVPVPPARETAEQDEPAASRGEFAGPGRRLAAGLADLVVHAAFGVVALFGCRGLGVRPELPEAPALGVFLLSFSFLYIVLPLAFWGHTPGMTWAGITSRNRDGEPLTFDQTARRWLGAILTLALAGLPLLLAFGGRSLNDWISGSATYPMDEEGEPEPAV
jgi:uncharacterized RDD family membrane protein YckC